MPKRLSASLIEEVPQLKCAAQPVHVDNRQDIVLHLLEAHHLFSMAYVKDFF